MFDLHPRLRLKRSVQCLCEWVQKPHLVRLVSLTKHDDATVKSDEVVSKRELMKITFSTKMFTIENKNRLTL
jgi:hypothetical protein